MAPIADHITQNIKSDIVNIPSCLIVIVSFSNNNIKTYLIISQVHVLHGEHSEFVGPSGVAAMFHVSGYREQLRGRHDVRCCVDHYLVGGLERKCFVLTQR